MDTSSRSWSGDAARGGRWLAGGRLLSALLLASLAGFAGEAFQVPTDLYLAALAAAGTAAVGWVLRDRRQLLAPIFLADVAWISTAVVGAGRADAGLGLLFALVAFAAGICLGGRLAMGVAAVAGLALVATVNGAPDLRMGPTWVLVQGLLVLALGAATVHVRRHLMSQERALVDASRALTQVLVDTDTIVENLSSGVLSVDAEGAVVHANRTAVTTLGIEDPAPRGRPWDEVFPAGTEAFREVLERGRLQGEAVVRGEIEIVRGERTVPLGVGTTVLRDEEGRITGVVALFQDLTEVRKEEEAVRRRDRLAAVGELAAGIAHEIRNSVLPLAGSMEILGQELDLNAEQERLFEVVAREMENIEKFVSELLRYTRTRNLELRAVDLEGPARKAADDLRLLGRPGIQVSAEPDPAGVVARIDPDQMEQALRNLVLNAADALGGEGGRIRVRTGTDPEGRPFIEVEDDGPGIPPADRQRVLEPFYTSKPGGTGLGLAIVTRIVEDHDGELRILDGRERGTRFRILLARMEPEALTRAA